MRSHISRNGRWFSKEKAERKSRQPFNFQKRNFECMKIEGCVMPCEPHRGILPFTFGGTKRLRRDSSKIAFCFTI